MGRRASKKRRVTTARRAWPSPDEPRPPSIGDMIEVEWFVDGGDDDDPEWNAEGRLVWWTAKVTRHLEKDIGFIMYSTDADKRGNDLLGVGDDSVKDQWRVEWATGNIVRHLDYTPPTILRWRYPTHTPTIPLESAAAGVDAGATAGDGRVASLVPGARVAAAEARLAELERVVHRISQCDQSAEVHSRKAPADEMGAQTRVLRQFILREVYDALYSKDPQGLARLRGTVAIDGRDGLDGLDTVVQTELQTRSVHCTLENFQYLAEAIRADFLPSPGDRCGDAVPGRHGIVRLVPSLLQVRFPNIRQDRLGIEFESYGDFCDALAMADFDRPVLVGPTATAPMCVVGTTVLVEGDGGGAVVEAGKTVPHASTEACAATAGHPQAPISSARPPSRYVFAGRSPFFRAERSGYPQGGGESATTCDAVWHVPILLQPDSTVQDGGTCQMATSFQVEYQSSADLESCLQARKVVWKFARDKLTAQKFSIVWSPAKGRIPPGAVFTETLGQVHCVIPVCVIRANQLCDAASDFLGPGHPVDPSETQHLDNDSEDDSEHRRRDLEEEREDFLRHVRRPSRLDAPSGPGLFAPRS